MVYFLISGTVLGLSAGFAPGPLLTLVILETLRHDSRAGIKVAFAPIITDLPIIILTLFVLSKLSSFHNILGIISIVGGFFILSISYECLRSKRIEFSITEAKPESLKKGILANVLSPHPYLFWFSVGAPTIIKAMNISSALIFVLSFYVSLVGSKIFIAVFIGKSKSFLSNKAYIYIMRFLGSALIVLAFTLFFDGLKLLGIIQNLGVNP